MGRIGARIEKVIREGRKIRRCMRPNSLFTPPSELHCKLYASSKKELKECFHLAL